MNLAIWIRAEVRPTERRTPLVPEDVAQLVAAGVHVTVERSARRIVPDEAFARAGADLADTGSWVDAPADTIVVGLKELPPEPAQLRHRHVFFGHAYKGQPGAQALLDRFVAGGGELLDLEYVCDDDGRRLVAYGWWAGYVGAALAVLQHRGRLHAPLEPMARANLDAALAARPGDPPARALVLGALGRSGRGALAALATAGVPVTAWDTAETQVLDRAALLSHDIVVNTVLSVTDGEPFLAPEHLPAPGRQLTVLSDVTCDVGSPCNRFPLYDDTTTWAEPVLRLTDGEPPFDAIVIDNLPSLLPLEASTSFSAALRPIIPELATGTGGWRSSHAAFRRALSERARAESAFRPTIRRYAMSDQHRPAVHWVGTGLSTGSGLGRLASIAPVTVWGRTEENAAACARRVGLPADVRTAAFSLDALAAAIAPGDVVVSMLPATEHPALLRAAIAGRAHFASSSYTSDEVAALAVEAAQAGIVVLTEAGLDPGLDHLLAHVLIDDARAELGDGPATASLTSYCGGVPATANDFRYRFSWAPGGVLTALLNPARYVEDGEITVATRPWEATREYDVDGEPFEAYPNRDSTGFVAQYGMPRQWQIESFVRGTLRLPGWHAAWKDVFAALAQHGTSVVDELAADLAARYPTTPADRDRVVLDVRLDVTTHDGRRWTERRLLDVVGDHTESAMAALVSGTLAVGIARILDGTLPAGLNRAAATHEIARPWIDELVADGITIRGAELDDREAPTPVLDGTLA